MKANDFGNYIKSLRTDKKLTIRQLELYSGVSNSYLSQLENGKRSIPSPEILKKLSKGLKVPYKELLDKAGYFENEEKEDTSLEELRKVVEDLGIQDIFFHNIDDWKNLNKDDIEDIKQYIEFIQQKAKRRNKD
ncbi:helix-turn-helix domain-containing protein [Virgibacillus halodenitrificans]|uniref:helix-turn-helix domain-containing protein n=1 Tax=Virgibacillus halodenitrificans TaxID=1482 RepID=UPI001369A0A9|nr:helix-turn-helix transcriptional regulator [Virgibacillus halodenitrificans]MYL45012.1 helix-turn-helix domain-containing protein [Virgibacillus halodenitrificans]